MIRSPRNISAPFFWAAHISACPRYPGPLTAGSARWQRTRTNSAVSRSLSPARGAPADCIVGTSPFLELAARKPRFAYLLPATSFLLGIATFSAIFAALLGRSLARSGGYSGPLMTQHMWGGLLVTVAAWSCWMLRLNSAGNLRRLYPATLVASVALVAFTGYRGGQLSQGENHLTELCLRR